jgi:selenocysteine-specific elongation factor
MAKNVIVGTAGHIDHGKSSLVEALTGTHPDRLAEEKRRGITIDLGFAFLDLGGARIGFVDVPGHERFVKNMLAGAGGIDLVLLVVAADESIKPQTHEHFEICRLLGIQRGVIAITKSDLVSPESVSLVKLEVEEFAKGSFLERAPIVSVSVKSGEGIAELKEQLLLAAQSMAAKNPQGHARLPIDRAFTMKGFGTVVTGTLVSGTLRRDQEVELLPSVQRARVRGIHSGGRAVPQAEAGQRTAVNLSDISVDRIHRGMVLAQPGIFRATQCLDARLTLLASGRKLKNHSRVHFHQGTAEVTADVILLQRDELAPGDSALVQFRLDQPIFALPGDRFIIRQFSPVATIGGGLVLNGLASRRKRGDSQSVKFLEALESGSREEILAVLAERSPSGLTLTEIVAQTGWLENEARAIAENLSGAGKISMISSNPMVITSAENMKLVWTKLIRELEQFHSANPLVPGISMEELRGRITTKFGPEVFNAALDDLVTAKKVTLTGDIVRLAGREISLSGDEARAKEQIECKFEMAGLAVPSVTEVLRGLKIDSPRAQKLLHLLIREKVLIKVTEELMFHRMAIEKLRGMLSEYKKKQGERLPIPAFKQMTGISRKYAIPLLEYLDRERLTRRVGDERVIL